MACDADSHYMLKGIPYLGKGTVKLKKPENLGEHLTKLLVSPYGGRQRTVTMDNWFTSVPLINSLKNSGIEVVGTIRPKPYLPISAVNNCKLDIGESVCAYNYEDKITLQCTRANKVKRVMLVSSIHHKPTMVDRKKTDIQMFYNSTKGGVDTFDQLCAASSCSRKTRRWPLCFFYGMLNIALVNAYIVYSAKSNVPAISRRDFNRNLAYQLCRPWAHQRLPNSLPRELKSTINHIFEFSEDRSTPSPGPGKTEKRKRCTICPHSETSKTRLLCASCQASICSRHQVSVCVHCYP